MPFDLGAFTTGDLWVLALAFGPPLVVGLPLLLASVRQPAEIEVQEVDPATLGRRVRRWHDGLDAKFAKLAYQPAGTFRVATTPTQTMLIRGYTSDVEPHAAAALSVLDAKEDQVSSETWIEFSTGFATGRSVSTASLRRSRLRRRMCSAEAHDAPGVKDPARLKAIHERNCAPHLVRGPEFAKAEVFKEALAEAWRRDMAHMHSTGLFRALPDGRTGITPRGSIRYILDTLSPIAGHAPARIAAALALGFCIPYLGQVLVADAMHRSILEDVPLPALAAFAVGWLFGTTGIFWAPVLAWAGRRAGAPDPVAFGLILTVWMPQLVASFATNLCAKLRARV
jgi:hypothetical protein